MQAVVVHLLRRHHGHRRVQVVHDKRGVPIARVTSRQKRRAGEACGAHVRAPMTRHASCAATLPAGIMLAAEKYLQLP